MTKSPCLLPPRLRPGDLIGLCCPAGAPKDAAKLEQGIEYIRAAGFEVRLAGSLHAKEEYLADTDAQRAAAFDLLWNDTEVKAVMAVRGGYGCLRLLPLLDLRHLGRQPKWLIGFSDVTVLLNALVIEAGLTALHAPVATSLSRVDEESRQGLFAFLRGHYPLQTAWAEITILRGGTGQGRLMGGNLCTLAHLLGTPWDYGWDGCILALEDISEPLYRLDRMFSQLAQAGRFARLAGLLLGNFHAGNNEASPEPRFTQQVWRRVLELAPPGFPIWGGCPFGHGEQNIPLPLGMEVLMDSHKHLLHFLP